jgi:hypothetical protein
MLERLGFATVPVRDLLEPALSRRLRRQRAGQIAAARDHDRSSPSQGS